MNTIVRICHEILVFFLFNNNFYARALISVAGCGSGDQPGHHPCFGECAEEVVPHVCWGAGQVQTGQHDGWHLWGDSPQGHPKDIWGQGSRYHWWPQEEPCSLRPNCAEKVSWFCTMTSGLTHDWMLSLKLVCPLGTKHKFDTPQTLQTGVYIFLVFLTV